MKYQVILISAADKVSGQYINKCDRIVGSDYLYFDYENDQIRLTKEDTDVMTYIKDCCHPYDLILFSEEMAKEGDYVPGYKEGTNLIVDLIRVTKEMSLPSYKQLKAIASTNPKHRTLHDITKESIEDWIKNDCPREVSLEEEFDDNNWNVEIGTKHGVNYKPKLVNNQVTIITPSEQILESMKGTLVYNKDIGKALNQLDALDSFHG